MTLICVHLRLSAIPFLLTAALHAQTFIQMSDPQFGMYTKDAGFAHETTNFEFAIATVNRLKPAFVVITGDLTNKSGDPTQIAEFKRIAAKLDPSIKLFLAPGNHDTGNEATPQSLVRYREAYGPDYYTFRIGDIAGFVLNSNLEKSTAKVPDEAAKMESWFRAELGKAKQSGAKQLIVFQHIPFFMKTPDEAEVYDNVTPDARARYLKLLHDYGVQHVFTGHYHHEAEASDGAVEIHITGPVGMPLKQGKSGMRIGKVADGKVTHKYYDFGDIPETIQ
jgi:3',5'-cyclic AMP phosphodiesterase CpdA